MQIAHIGGISIDVHHLVAGQNTIQEARKIIEANPNTPKLIIHELTPLIYEAPTPIRKFHLQSDDKCTQHRAGTKKKGYTA